VGSATVICSDKTGTLTQNKMQVVRLGIDGQLLDKGTATWATPAKGMKSPGTPLDWIALNAAVNSTANLEEKEGRLLAVGNPTHGARPQGLHGPGCESPFLHLEYPSPLRGHSSPEGRRMTGVLRPGGSRLGLVKGAPGRVLAQATSSMTSDGCVRGLTEPVRDKVLADLRD